ncbi:hypothetical protein ABH920_006550 [Catenulispora sp. EB89]|uniref:WXG100-like domain-containing protein n=1 Tax=Catenulispora sp. EB89 TaxID=3156257 RepID=UPI0035158D0C
MTTEVPAPVQWLLAIVCGQEWPDGDEQALRAAGQAWTDAATALQPAFADADTAAKKAASSYGGTASEAFTKFWNMFTQPQGDQPAILDGLVKQCQDIGQELDGFADEVETSRIEIIGQLVILAVEIAIAQSLAPLTFGLSELSIAGEVAATRLVVRELLEAVLKAAFKAALKMTVQMTALDLLAQGIEEAQGHRTSIDWGEVGKTAEGAAISGAFAGALGGVLGKAAEHTPALRSALNKPFGKVASNAAIGVGSTLLTDVATGQAIDGHGLLDAALGGIGGAAHERFSQRTVHVADDRIPGAGEVPGAEVPAVDAARGEAPRPDGPDGPDRRDEPDGQPPAAGGGPTEPSGEPVVDRPAVGGGPVESGHQPRETDGEPSAEPIAPAASAPDILSALNGGAHYRPAGHFLGDPLSRPLPVGDDSGHEPVTQPVHEQRAEPSPATSPPTGSTAPEHEPAAEATHAPAPSPDRSGDMPTGPRMSHEAAARALFGVDDNTPLTADQKARFEAALEQRKAQTGARDGVVGLVDQLRGRTPGTLLQDDSSQPSAAGVTSQTPENRPVDQALRPDVPTRAVLGDERLPEPVVQPPIIEAPRGANQNPVASPPNRENASRREPQTSPRPEPRTAMGPEPRSDTLTEPEHIDPEHTDPQDVIESAKDDIAERALGAVAARHGLVLGGSRAMARYGLIYRRTDDIDLIATGGHEVTHDFSDDAVNDVRRALTEAGYTVTVKPSQSGAELTVRRGGFSTKVDMTSTPLLPTYEPPVEVGGLRMVSANDAVRMKYGAFKAAAGDPEPDGMTKLAKQLADVHAVFAERGDDAFVLDGINPAEEKDVFRGMLGKALDRVTDDDLADHGLSPEQIARLRADLAEQAARRELVVPAAPVTETPKPSAADVQAVLKMLYPDNPARGWNERRVAKAAAIAAQLRKNVSLRYELRPEHLAGLVRSELDEGGSGTLSKDQRDRLSGFGRPLADTDTTVKTDKTAGPANTDRAPVLATAPAAEDAPHTVAEEVPRAVPEPALPAPADEASRPPAEAPTAEATDTPTAEAIDTPVAEAIDTPVAEAIDTPVAEATDTPTAEATDTPTTDPVAAPSADPAARPAAAPTFLGHSLTAQQLEAFEAAGRAVRRPGGADQPPEATTRRAEAWDALANRVLKDKIPLPDLLDELAGFQSDTGLTLRENPELGAALRTIVPRADIQALGPLHDLAAPFDRTLGALRDGPARGLTDELLRLSEPTEETLESTDPLEHLDRATDAYRKRVAGSGFRLAAKDLKQEVEDLRRGWRLLKDVEPGGGARELPDEVDSILVSLDVNVELLRDTALHAALILRLNATLDHFLGEADPATRRAFTESRFRRTAATRLEYLENSVRERMNEPRLPQDAVRRDQAFGSEAELAAFGKSYVHKIETGLLLGDPADKHESSIFADLTKYSKTGAPRDQFLVALHGNPDFVRAGHDDMSPKELALVIRASGWDGKQAIRLHSCKTGASDDGFGRQLARELRVRVVAPSDTAVSTSTGDVYVTSVHVARDGTMVVRTSVDGTWRTFEPDDAPIGLADDPHAGPVAWAAAAVRGARGDNGVKALLPDASETARHAVKRLRQHVSKNHDRLNPGRNTGATDTDRAGRHIEVGVELVKMLRARGALEDVVNGTHPGSELHQAIKELAPLFPADPARSGPAASAPDTPLTAHGVIQMAGAPGAVRIAAPPTADGWQAPRSGQTVVKDFEPTDKFEEKAGPLHPFTHYKVTREGRTETDEFWTGADGNVTHARIHTPKIPIKRDAAGAEAEIATLPDAHYLLGGVHYRFHDEFGDHDFRTDAEGKPIPERTWNVPAHDEVVTARWSGEDEKLTIDPVRGTPGEKKEIHDVKAFIDLQHKSPESLRPNTCYIVEQTTTKDNKKSTSKFWTSAEPVRITHVDTWSDIKSKTRVNPELGIKDAGLNRFYTAVKPDTVYRVNNRITYHTNAYGSPSYVRDERGGLPKEAGERHSVLQLHAGHIGLAKSRTAVEGARQRLRTPYRDESLPEILERARKAAQATVYLASYDAKKSVATSVIKESLPAKINETNMAALIRKLSLGEAEAEGDAETAPPAKKANAKSAKLQIRNVSDDQVKAVIADAQTAADAKNLTAEEYKSAAEREIRDVLSKREPPVSAEDLDVLTERTMGKVDFTVEPKPFGVGELFDIGLHQRFPGAGYAGGHIVDAKSGGPKELVNYHPQFGLENSTGAWFHQENHLAALQGLPKVKVLSYEVLANWRSDYGPASHPTTPSYLTTRTVLEFKDEGTSPKNAVLIRTFPNLPAPVGPRPDPGPAPVLGTKRRREQEQEDDE